MKLLLPDSFDDIILEDYQKFKKLDSTLGNYLDLVFSLFTKIDIEDVVNVPEKDYNEILNHIYNALQQQGEFKRLVTIDSIELGVIPDFNKITAGEYTDLVTYSSKEKDGYNPQLNRLIAVMFRPVKSKDNSNNYKIEKYNGTEEHLHLINKLPMSLVMGSLVLFFDFVEKIRKSYPKVYGGGTSEGAVALRYFEEWGFYASLYEIVSGNYFELKKLEEENIHRVHGFLSIRNHNNKLKAELMKPKK